MGFTAAKNTVCLSLLEFCPPAINPEFVTECKLTAHPICKMYSKKLFGINSLPCSEGSTELRPEWSWRAWRLRISCPDGSVQCWNLFLLPPPPAILLHISSDHCWEFSNLFRRSSFSLQNSIAPSHSRSNSPCRRRVFILFDTGLAWSIRVPGSISIHFLSRIGKVFEVEDEQVVEGLFGFALALDRLAVGTYFRLRCRGLLLVVVVLLVDQVCDQFVQDMRNSDPRVRNVVVHRFNTDFHSVFNL